MKRPSLQWYPADWRNNAKLRRCSWAARGVWIELLGLMHDSDEYGVLRWPLKEIAQALGAPIALLKELVDKEVLKGGDKGMVAYLHTPIHARKKGAPVQLIAATTSACWYSSRLVIDEWRRQSQGANTRFKGKESAPDPAPDVAPSHSPSRVVGEWLGDAPSRTPNRRQSDGATSTSTSIKETSSHHSTVVEGEGGDAVSPKLPGTPEGRLAVALRKAGVSVTSVNPKLMSLVAMGVTEQEALECVAIARHHKKPPQAIPMGYLESVIISQREQRPNANADGKASAGKPWYLRPDAIARKAWELGLVNATVTDDKKIQDKDFQLQVLTAAGISAEQVRQAEVEWSQG